MRDREINRLVENAMKELRDINENLEKLNNKPKIEIGYIGKKPNKINLKAEDRELSLKVKAINSRKYF